MKIFILEDGVRRNGYFSDVFSEEQFVICNEANLAKTILSNEEFDVLFLDHDLGRNIFMGTEEENTGSTVVKHLITLKDKNIPIVIHSWNPSAADYMKNTLVDGGWKGNVIVVPYMSDEFYSVVDDVLGVKDVSV